MARTPVDFIELQQHHPRAFALLDEGMREAGLDLEEQLEVTDLCCYTVAGELYVESHDEKTLEVWRGGRFVELRWEERPDWD